MNDEEFFSLLNKYPLRSDNPTDNTTPTTSSQPDLFSILNNVMSGFSNNNNNNRISNSKEDEFWIKLKQFLDSKINSQEEADIIYNNFKKNHLKYINEQEQKQQQQ